MTLFLQVSDYGDFLTYMWVCISFPSIAPDRPNPQNGVYLMDNSTDYAQQTLLHNEIDDQEIWALMRVVCYNQTIYDDQSVEGDEYAGLSLSVRQSTITTYNVRPLYDQAAILIIDDDDDGTCTRFIATCVSVFHDLHSRSCRSGENSSGGIRGRWCGGSMCQSSQSRYSVSYTVSIQCRSIIQRWKCRYNE